MKLKIGVMGSAQGPTIKNDSSVIKAEQVGKYIALNNCILINGACPGLPNDAARGAKNAGGFVMGISPGFSLYEHIEKYSSPNKYYDIILFTGMGLMERDIINIRSSDAIVIVGGGVGTLNEFIIAYDEDRHVGVLKGSGGISDHIETILKFAHRQLNDKVIIEEDPKILIEKLIRHINNDKRAMVEDQRVITKNFFPFGGHFHPLDLIDKNIGNH